MPAQSTSRLRVAVVGGGIAGLAAARALLASRPGLEVVVLEGGAQVGGKLRGGELAGRSVDLGAEAILNRRPEAVSLAREVGLGPALTHPVASGAGIWSHGRLRPIPPSILGIPGDPEAVAATGLLSEAGMARLRAEEALPPLRLAGDVAVGELVAERLGAEVRDRLVEPLLGGVYAGRADRISLQAAVPALAPAVREYGSLLAAARALLAASAAPREPRPPVFAGLDGGVARLAGATAEDISRRGGTVRCRATVRELARAGAGWRLTIGSAAHPETLDADAVVLATPAAPTARLLREVAPAAAADLGGIGYAPVAVVSLALRPTEPASLAGTGYLVPPVEQRVVKGVTFASRKWGWLGGDLELLRCSVGRVGEEEALQREDAELVAVALRELREVTGIQAELADSSVTRWGGALPQYGVGHVARVGRIRAAVAGLPGLAVCGAAYDGVGIPACIASAEEAAARVLAALAAG
ncbi:MAG TPA: protoporphyrinogen oxidase [Nocardioidaceae bacterium]|nr:protoporphyrinogen oxidase [Nocardioidaceae bacterium]